MRNSPSKIGEIVRAVVLTGSILLGLASPSWSLRDPAASYCSALGYQMEIVLTAKGEKVLCTLPDDRVVDGWQFYSGKVALDASYCAQQGLEPRHVEDPEICRNCTVCELPEGGVMRVDELMGLDLRETTCGDGRCVVAENNENCPDDCPTGGPDDLCDGVEDQRCDLDCVETGDEEKDADCSRCTGDCDWNGEVAISELVRGVNIALGSLRIPICEVLDTDTDGEVAVNELVQAVNAALFGCPKAG